MKRKIQFRGLRTDGEGWATGDLIHLDDHTLIAGNNMWSGIFDGLHVELAALEVDPSTAGQYTGIDDKNGKEIYEGDTIHWKCEWGIATCVVVFGLKDGEEWHAAFGFWMVEDGVKEPFYLGLMDVTALGIEVIGNIHQQKDAATLS